VKDFNFEAEILTVHGKGKKDRTVPLPETIVPELTFQLDLPGHGEVCTQAYLDEQASFIKDWVASIKEAIKNKWTLEEAQQRISFLDRYPMGAGMEAFGPELQKMNVARLYALAGEGKL
jgi:hypothetical protein